MGKFSDIAKKSVNNNSIMAGREKISTDDIIAVYPNGISINSVNMVTYQGNEYPVFTFVEDDSKYFSGGKALKSIVNAWVDACEGDISEINVGISAEPVKIKLTKIKTSTGRNFVKVDIVDE